MRRTRWNHAAGFKAKVVLAANPDLDPRHERAANLVAEAIAWMAHSSNRWIPEGLTVNGARRRIARRAQEYIEELFPRPSARRTSAASRRLAIALCSVAFLNISGSPQCTTSRSADLMRPRGSSISRAQPSFETEIYLL